MWNIECNTLITNILNMIKSIEKSIKINVIYLIIFVFIKIRVNIWLELILMLLCINLLFMNSMSFLFTQTSIDMINEKTKHLLSCNVQCCLLFYVWQMHTSAISFHNDNTIVLHNTNIARKRKESSDMFT